MDYAYLATPFLTWLIAGSIKFAVNAVRSGKDAVGLIGYGGFPSNHSAIVSSMAALIATREGMAAPAFGVAVTLAFIVILDAASLRKEVGRQAQAINRITAGKQDAPVLRERMGHSRVEVLGGVFIGIAVGYAAGVLLH